MAADSDTAVQALAPVANDRAVESRILVVRGENVMLDSDLACLYGVPVKRLNEAVRRNSSRFPDDFMFQLSPTEADRLRSQNATSNDASSERRGGRRYRPYVFTEQGVAMLSSVLGSSRAIAVNVEIMRTFVRLRRMLSTHVELARKLDQLEAKYDRQFKVVFDAIRRLMERAPTHEHASRKIGFGA